MTTYVSASDFIKATSRDYSIYVCQSRGIPSVCDGLKDAQRKALFIIKPKGEKIKTVSLAGEMISSNIYLHGDASAAETLSLMAALYCNNIPFLHGIGAFGTKVGPTDWGAPRYTYLKKYNMTEALIYPDYDIIPLKENYDGSVMAFNENSCPAGLCGTAYAAGAFCDHHNVGWPDVAVAGSSPMSMVLTLKSSH